MEYTYGAEAARLLEKDADCWTYRDLDTCGELLFMNSEITSDEKKQLRKKLVIDPRVVCSVLGLTQPGSGIRERKKTGEGEQNSKEEQYEIETVAIKEGQIKKETRRIKEAQNDKKNVIIRDTLVNMPLCLNTAHAFYENRRYYNPLQERDPDTVSEFSALAWEYLQQDVHQIRKGTKHFSMRRFLIQAARPNGWIGVNPAFHSADSRHKKRAEQRNTNAYLIDSGISIDAHDPGGDPLLDKYPETVFACRTDFMGMIEAEDCLERIKKRMKGSMLTMPEIELYMAACLLEERPLHLPSRSAREFVRLRMKAFGRNWSDEKVRLWFHRCYRALMRAAAKEARYCKR